MFFPEFGRPRLVANIGWLGLQAILQSGGSGYFPRRLVDSHLASGRLHLVPRAPDFRLPAYVVHPDEAPPAVAMAVASIREIALAASEEPGQTVATMNRRRKGNRVRPSGRLG
jgi:DNA-binding transcriptional LysR family regulator